MPAPSFFRGLLTVIFCLAVSQAFAAKAVRVLDNKRVDPDTELARAVCTGWVEVTSGGAEVVDLWDIKLGLDPGTRVIVGCNSVYLYALCIDGRFHVGGQKVPAGKIAVWGHYREGGPKPLIYVFSAQRMNETLAAMRGGRSDPSLAALAATQRRKQWWGLITPTKFNVAMPVPKELDDARRLYQTKPELIAIKRESRNNDEYAQNTALAFGIALKTRDVRLVTSLLSPGLFTQDSALRDPTERLTKDREAFAKHLLAQADYREIAPGTLKHHGSGLYTMRMGARAVAVQVASYDDGLYVGSLVVQ